MISREHKLRKGAYSVLIVCEGQNTEPSYFSKFQNYLNENINPNTLTVFIFLYFPTLKKKRNN